MKNPLPFLYNSQLSIFNDSCSVNHQIYKLLLMLRLNWNKILEEFTKVKTLRCNFKEEKKMSFLDEVQKSTGIMLFKAKNLLRWEYKVPNNYIFVLNNQKVYLKNDKGTSHFNTSSNKVMKTMSQLIIGTINGESLRNNADFKIDYFKSSK